MQTKTKAKKSQIKSGKQKKEFSFPLERENFIIIAFGIIVLIIGYVLMAQNSVDGFMPTIVSPVLLVAGYCVIIPYGILKRAKTSNASTEQTSDSEPANISAGSNIKTS